MLLMKATASIPSRTISGYASIRYAMAVSPAVANPNPMNPSPIVYVIFQLHSFSVPIPKISSPSGDRMAAGNTNQSLNSASWIPPFLLAFQMTNQSEKYPA
ncbi:hypothetical protein OGAPHI_002797 [Ogataea philodendri]|uniref:Uncharacterized protein n=1 Tax=Ogataea philodendri TaxID=1378263 RepID=A0A9P8P7E0_9ASCO|nr:uncharacterized protein OGAPHI_002797 [Ogataea philodendri]KAH3667148.1 hypothetical protein OGAPHI_002797 [Ogataea philodendri]